MTSRAHSDLMLVGSFPSESAEEALRLAGPLFGDCCLSDPGLEVPHPRLHERAFVLEPLSDLAPDFVHPKLGRSIARLAEEQRDPGAVRAWPGTFRVEDFCAAP